MSESLSALAEAGIAVGVTLVFVAMLYAAGLTSENGLTQTGTYLAVGGIVAFILLMTAAGYWISTKE